MLWRCRHEIWGSNPTDPNSPYLNTATVTVLGNTGNLTKTSHTFVGWSTNSGAAAAQYTAGSTFTISSNVVLYAVWVPPLSVTYNGNGNSGGSAPTDPNSPYQYGSTVTLLGQGSLWLTGWNFHGWSMDPSGLGTIYAPGSTFVIAGNTVLYAIWLYGGPPTGNQYTVTYHANGAGVTGSPPVDYNVYQSGNTVTVLGQGTLDRVNYVFLGWATTSNAVTPDRMPGTTFTMPSNNVPLYAVWRVGGTVVVPFDGRRAGLNGSKQETINYQTGYPTIMQVATNLPNNTDKSAVIENLIINGLNLSNNATGILLENVCGCLIRNVTIMNCEVGIRVKLTGTNGSFSRNNRFEHIRMINVKTGILFEGTSSAKDFSYTVIDDVGISLASNSTDTGIKVGNNNLNADLYGAFVKANVWLNGSNGTGLGVDGKIRGSFVNLAVTENGYNVGRCIFLNSNADISKNQSFLLAVLGVTNNIVLSVGSSYSGIKIVP